jgi:hypothetical protein
MLAQFHALTHAKAAEVWHHTSAYRRELVQYIYESIPVSLPSTSRFFSIAQIDAEKEGMDATTQQLRSLNVSNEDVFVIMWEPRLALAMTWKTFCDNWVDLCLPASDDVTVCAVSETFAYQYYHEDQIVYGAIRFPVQEEDLVEKPSSRPQLQREMREELLRLLQVQDKIAAIHIYRQKTGVLLREAKDVVDALAAEITEEQAQKEKRED